MTHCKYIQQRYVIHGLNDPEVLYHLKDCRHCYTLLQNVEHFHPNELTKEQAHVYLSDNTKKTILEQIPVYKNPRFIMILDSLSAVIFALLILFNGGLTERVFSLLAILFGYISSISLWNFSVLLFIPPLFVAFFFIFFSFRYLMK